MPLVCSAATAIVMYSDHPDIVLLRAQVTAAYTQTMAPNAPDAAATATDLQRLRARTVIQAAQCPTPEDCTLPQAAQGSSGPRFIKVPPAE